MSITAFPPSPNPASNPASNRATNSPAGDTVGPAFRTLPYNVEAERGVLGAILLDNRAFEKVSDFLLPEHFAWVQHGSIFDAIQKLIEKGQIADPVTLKTRFDQDSSLAEMGGSDYLGELAAHAVSLINAGEYGRIVHDLYLKRALIAIGQDVIENASSKGEETPEATLQIEQAEQSLYDLATNGSYGGEFISFKDAIDAAIMMAEKAHHREGSLSGVTCGFRDIDDLLGGLHQSDLLILAGRPSMGKTALATNIAYQAAHAYDRTGGEEGAVVGFFSLEMSAEQLASRILAEQAEVTSDKIRKGMMGNDEFNRLAAAAKTLHEIPIFIDDTPALSISALRTRSRRLKRQHNLGLIVLDYLQLVNPSRRHSGDNRVQEISEITRGLKTLAKELNVPVLALSQLSRQVEARDDKRPLLSDLRESGTIEQDADVVAFIFREEYYLSRGEPSQRENESMDKYAERHQRWYTRLQQCRNLAEVLVAKQRHGPTGKVTLHFHGEYTRFSDYTPLGGDDRAHNP